MEKHEIIDILSNVDDVVENEGNYTQKTRDEMSEALQIAKACVYHCEVLEAHLRTADETIKELQEINEDLARAEDTARAYATIERQKKDISKLSGELKECRNKLANREENLKRIIKKSILELAEEYRIILRREEETW